MSTDNYKIERENNEINSIFALKISNYAKNITGYIYYFNKFDDEKKTIKNLGEFNKEKTKINIIVYNYKAKKLSYYHPTENPEIANELNKYDKCMIVNIIMNEYNTTYIFLSEERNNQIINKKIFKDMTKENKKIFDDNDLFNIVKRLFNIIEDYNMNIGSVPVAKRGNTTISVSHDNHDEVNNNENEAAKNAAAQEAAAREAAATQQYAGKRKYKANVNQKSLKKMSTIIKKLLKINLNIKQAAKPKAKPKAKPVAKPKAKPATKPVAKPKAKK